MNLGVHTSIQEYAVLIESSFGIVRSQTCTNVIFQKKEWFQNKLFEKVKSHPNYKTANIRTIEKLKFILTNEIFDESKIFFLTFYNILEKRQSTSSLIFRTYDYKLNIEYRTDRNDLKLTYIRCLFDNLECLIILSDNDDDYIYFQLTVNNGESFSDRLFE